MVFELTDLLFVKIYVFPKKKRKVFLKSRVPFTKWHALEMRTSLGPIYVYAS